MKKVVLSIYTIAIAAGAFGQPLDRSIRPTPGPAPEVKLGKTESFTLANGMKVFVVENHKLPTIAASIQLDIKPELEGDMTGYRDMMSDLLVSGTTTRSKDKLNGEIDFMGATIQASDEGVAGSGLKKYQDKIFELMADIAMNAVIKQDELDRLKKRTLSGIETKKNDGDAMVRNVSAVVNFGSNHPYGEVTTPETVKKITLERCMQYYKTYFRPNVAYMAIVGDVTAAEVKPLIEKYFGKWQQGTVPVASYTMPALTGTHRTKVAFAPRVAAVQSVVRVTYPIDLKPGADDVIKAKVANTILGGGSQGRLFTNIRERHGWGYGSYSTLREDDLGGSFFADLKCKNNVSDSALEALLTEMRIIRTERVNDTTLRNTINYISGNFAIGLEDPNRIAQYAINIERYHMPKDYYTNYLKNLGAVTKEDVIVAANKYIRPDNANIVVAGSKDEVAGKLAKFSDDGKVAFYDYTGQPMTVSTTMPAPAGMTADKVFKSYLDATGGEKALNGIKDIKITGKSDMHGTPLTIVEMKKAPGMWKQYINVTMAGHGMTVQKQVYDGTKGYQEQQGKKADLTGDDLEEIKMGADITMDLHPEKYGIKRTLKGMENINGSNAYIVEVQDGKGKKSTEYYDAASAMLVRKVQGEGEKMQISDYADYKEIPGTNGYKLPYKVTQSAGGQTFTEDVESVEVNKNIPDSEFK